MEATGVPRRVLVLAVLPEHQWTPNTDIRPGKCVPGGIRTPNLLIRSQKLYPVELQALTLKNPKTQVPNPKLELRNSDLLEFVIWNLGFA